MSVTIAITIRTSAAVVFAADSKVSTSGLGGYKDDGTPVWLDQSYDNAYKVTHDKERELMAMIVGHANAGQIGAIDFIASYSFPRRNSTADQDAEIGVLADAITTEISAYWNTTKVDPSEWRTPKLIVATVAPDRRSARLWKGSFNPPKYEFSPFLPYPALDTDGSYTEVDSLLFGVNWDFWADVRKQWGKTNDDGREALKNLKVLMPINRFNFYSMPTQDAIDLAVFLAEVQIKMDRFMPGTAVCGGPIDVMVLHLAPEPSIVAYYGKTIHHPGAIR
jgi:hypothetical protein